MLLSSDLYIFPVAVWSPAIKRDKDLLERVQQSASRLITTLGKLNYEERLKALDLATLSERRQK